MRRRIFLSSIQKEFASGRKILKENIEKNPILRRFFSVFAFELDVPAAGKKTDDVYLTELADSDIYIGLFGNDYGFEGADGVSPTEREFGEATRLGIQRLIFVSGSDDALRSPGELAFLRRISPELIRRRYADQKELLSKIYASLDLILEKDQSCRELPFDASPCDQATLDDINKSKVRWFLRIDGENGED